MDPSNRSDKCVVIFIDIYVTVKVYLLKENSEYELAPGDSFTAQ